MADYPKTQKNKISPYVKLLKILLLDRKNLMVFLVYTVITSLLYLAIPLSAQILVNTIAAGVLMQPLILISISVLIGLVFLGILRILKIYITEILQRKIFAKISLDIANKIPEIKQKYFSEIYAPELVNRFFDTMTIQKSLATILLEVPASLLQILIGLIIMGIYSPLLMIFDTLLIFSIIIIALLGYKGLETSLHESSAKYKVAHWLEEIARCQVSFKMNGQPKFIVNETDNRILNYLDNRQKHFKVLLRQYSASFLVEAFATTGVLIIGGWLVISGKFTLGQLVASELIVLMILSAVDKIVQKLESWYDLLTGIEKVTLIQDFDSERLSGLQLLDTQKGSEISCEDLVFSYNKERKIFDKINFKIEAGSRSSLVGMSGSGKTTLAYLIVGLHEPDEGNILLNGFTLKSVSLEWIRESIAFVSDSNEIFDGTVEDNILLGRTHLTNADLTRVIELVELDRDLKQYPYGIKTKLLSEGRNISLGQRQRILLARAIISTPKLLILDEAFGGIDQMTKLKIIKNLFDKSHPWTILSISHDSEVVEKTDYVFLLEKGKIHESGDLNSLAQVANSRFSELFPELVKKIQKGIS
jgi:ATP-binding cassette subfamily B protein